MHQCISSFLRSLQRQMQRTKPHTLQFDPIRSHPTTPCPVPNNTPRHMNEAKVKRTNIFQNLLQGSKVKGQSMLSNVRIRGGHSRLTETHERRTRSCKRMVKYTMHTRTRHEREVKLNSKESKTKDRMKNKAWRNLWRRQHPCPKGRLPIQLGVCMHSSVGLVMQVITFLDKL